MTFNDNELEAILNSLTTHINDLKREKADFYEEDDEWQTINTELKFTTHLYSKIDNYLDNDYLETVQQND